MANQLNYLKLTIACILLASCTTQPGKVEFPKAETEFKKPKTVKATPTIRQIPDSLPNAKYTKEKGTLIPRDQSIPLKKPITIKAGTPKVTKSKLNQRVPANPQKRLAGTPKKVKAKGKKVPARGKVVKARQPISKPYMPPAVSDQDNFGLRYISQDQNLPGTIGYALLEDSQGRIWIGTDNGLAMLEGGEMKIYTTQEGLSSNIVLSLLESSTGAIWIGTWVGGVDVYESNSFTHYGTEEGLSSNSVFSLLESSTGSIWIGTDGGGVDIFESGSFTHYGVEEGLSNNRVYSLLESSTGAIWIGTNGGGVDVLESGSFLHYGTEEGLSDNSVWSLLESTSGAIWIGTNGGGVDVLESGSFLHYGTQEGLSNNNVRRLLESSTGAIWIGTSEGGVDVLESGIFTHYGVEEGLSNDYVRSLLESTSGAIWIGTNGGGVDMLESGSFTHYGTEEGLSNMVFSLLESTSGAIWIGTYGGGVDVLESGSFFHYGTQEGLSSNPVRSLLESTSGAIWIGADGGGVDVFESGSFLHYGTDEGLSSNRVRSLLESSSGAIWIGTDGGGVNIYQSDRFTHYGTDDGLSSNSVLSLLESSTGAIWIGTFWGGVDVFESGSFTHYGTDEGLSNNSVLSLLESSTGAIWIGTYGGGVDVLESGSFTHYGVEEGLADNAVLQLAMDSLGNIWAGTGKGLTRFVAKEDEYQLTTWNKSHGLKYMDFNGPGSPMYFAKTDHISKKGTMWSGVGGVLTAFEPPLADTLRPSMFLTGIDIAQESIDWNKVSDVKEMMKIKEGINPDTLFFPNPDSVLLLSNFPPDTGSLTSAGINWSGTEDLSPYHLPENLELAYDQNHLTFHYSGMKLNEQFDVVYRYMLEGLDKNWSPFTKEGKTDYRNIPHGKYTFSVRARGRNFLWSDEASISFVVHPPWWLTWWAKTLYVVLVFGSFIIIYKTRTRYLKKLNKDLETKVEERTKEVVQKNEEIQAQSEGLKTQAEELTAQSEELKASNEQLVELGQFKEAMTGMIVHDFKNSLNTVISFSDGTPNARRLKSIKSASRHMLSMVLNMLDIQKFEQAEVALGLANNAVVAEINEAAEQVSFLLEQKSIKLIYKLEDNVYTNCDLELISRVIVNLLTNAIKYTPANGSIHVEAAVQGEFVKLSVSDTGQGIPKDKLHTIFEKFAQAEAKKSGEVRSTGLGLTFCKMVVEAHGGEIGVESQEGKGSTFWFTLQKGEAPEGSKEEIVEITLDTLTENVIELNKKDKAILQPYMEHLQKLEVYDFSDVKEIILSIEANGNPAISSWLEEMNKAVQNVNEEMYKKLINDL